MRQFLRRQCRCFQSIHAGCGLGIDTPQHSEEHIVIRLVVDVMNIHIADDAPLVEHKQGAFRVTIPVSKHIIAPGRLAVGPKIAQERITYPAQAFCPGLQTVDMVNADTQDLGI